MVQKAGLKFVLIKVYNLNSHSINKRGKLLVFKRHWQKFYGTKNARASFIYKFHNKTSLDTKLTHKAGFVIKVSLEKGRGSTLTN